MKNTILGAAGIFVGGLMLGGAFGYMYKEKHQESFVTAGGEFIFPVSDFDCSIIFDEESEQQVYLLESNLMYADMDEEYDEDPDAYDETVVEEYHSIVKTYDTEDEDEPPFVEDKAHADVIDLDADNEKLIEADGEKILVIPFEVMGTHEFYETEALMYYAPNDLLVDNRDEVVTDHEDVIGDGLEHFGELSGDPDVVYIRNHNHQCDYEIIRMHAPWDVLEEYDA